MSYFYNFKSKTNLLEFSLCILQLDVKEAQELITGTDHPQSDISESEESQEGEGSDLSEYTSTDDDLEDDEE
jgi:hypothetical protein